MSVIGGCGDRRERGAAALDVVARDVDETLVACFARVVGACGERTALATDRRRITFAELDATADAVAAGVQSAGGIGAERVAILMQHDAPQIIAMLAVLKAGRVAVVLDPGSPEARLRSILDDADPQLIVADAARLDLAAAVAGRERIAGFDELAAGTRRPYQPPNSAPRDTAALVYTSGTTGRPKAVMQTHRHIRDVALRLSHVMGLGPGDRMALVAALSGAQGLCTAWQALLAGSALHPFATMERGVTGLADWLIEHRITAYVSSASLLRSFIRTLHDEARIPDMRVLRVASEMATADDFRAVQRHFAADCRFVHSLAASEVGAIACLTLNAGDTVPDGRLAVGRPLDGIEIKLVDEHGSDVPAGSPGEIIVRSRAMAAGYWRNPALTAQRFSDTADGWSSFRTGDLGRFDADGNLTFLGRRDTRVKIRGNSIELSEVEDALARLPQVDRAIARTSARPGSSEQQLVAYVVLRRGEEAAAGALRRALRTALPGFMIPSAFVFLDGFPLTGHGKIDHERLAREHPIASVQAPAEAARTPTESVLAEIWAAAFDLAGIGRGDDFFDLGGDSLTAAVIAARIDATFGVELRLSAFLEHPTLAALAARVDAGRREGVGSRPSLRGRGVQPGPAPLSFSQERVWRYSQTPQQSAGYTMSTSYVVDGPLDVAALRACMSYLAGRHEILRTTFERIGGDVQQVVHPPEPVPLPVVDFAGSAVAESEAAAFVKRQSARVFDLSRLPLAEFTLIRLREDLHWLLYVGFHIVSDGWSWNLYFRELAQLYAARIAGENPPLPAVAPVQYGDYARWQREALKQDGPAFAASLAWWKARFAARPRERDLPFRRWRPRSGLDPADGQIALPLAPEIALRLDALARQHGCTPFICRLAAFAALLSDVTSSPDVVVGTYVSNRSQAALRDLFGFLANLVTLRFAVDRRRSFSDWLATVRSAVSETETHAQIPYEMLRECLQADGIDLPEIRVIFGSRTLHVPVQLGAARLTLRRKQRETMPWGFTASIGHSGEEEVCGAHFDAGLYDPEGARALLARLVRLLDHASRDPRPTLDALLARSREDA